MALSAYPIYGLVHKVDIVRKADAYDAAGNITPGGAETGIYAARDARVSELDGEEAVGPAGQVGPKRWQVVLQYSANVATGDFLRLSATSNPAPIAAGQDYRILEVKPRFDHLGGFHHTSLVVELEDKD